MSTQPETPVRVLVIEDSPTAVAIIRGLLARVGEGFFQVESAGTLADGTAYIGRHNVQVILLDLTLPDSEGLDTFREIYRHASHLPIVVLSGTDDENIAMEAVREGAQDYLVKGKVDSKALTHSVRYAVERKRAEMAQIQQERFQGALEMAAAACHELNQPLQAVSGYSEMLLAGPCDEEKLHERLIRIKEGVERIGEITKKLNHVVRYVTRDYVNGEKIVDLDKASTKQWPKLGSDG